MKAIIDEIREKMMRFPLAHIEYDETSITYLPSASDGFAVRLVVYPGTPQERYSVYFNGSHEEFVHPRDAILTFGYGLSTDCRLREYVRLGRAYRWIVDVWDEKTQQWKPDWEICWFTMPFWQFWRRPTVRYLQNRLIDRHGGDVAHAA